MCSPYFPSLLLFALCAVTLILSCEHSVVFCNCSELFAFTVTDFLFLFILSDFFCFAREIRYLPTEKQTAFSTVCFRLIWSADEIPD